MASRTKVLLALVASLLFPAAASAGLQKAKDDLAVTATGHSVWVNVLANDAELGADLRLLKAFKPAHGSVVLENGGVRYTPDAGFQGSDSFRYMAQPAKSQPGEATVDVEVGSGGVALTLRGRVVDDPLPGAVVTAAVAGFEFRAVADAQGNYSLDIAALRGDAFVTLVATGRTPSGHQATFYSVVGEIARLSAAAGSDAILVRDENNQVQVTNLSTAQYSLLAEANGGQPVGNDQQLLSLVNSIALDRLLELAAVVKLAVENNIAGGDVLTLISDPTAVSNFEASLGAGVLLAAEAAVEADPQVSTTYHAGAMPSGAYVLLPPSRPGTIQPFLGVARLLEFPGINSGITSGNGGDNDLSFASDPTMHWQLETSTGDILVTPLVPYVTHDNLVLATGGGPCTDMGWYSTDTTVSSRLHRLQDGYGVDYVEVTDILHRHFTDADDPDNCPAPTQDSEIVSSYLRLAFEGIRGELPYSEGEAFGSYALTYYVPGEQRWGTALFEFGASTGSGVGTVPSAGLTFSWNIDSGHLILHMSDGNEYEYWRFQSDGHKGEGVLAVAVLSDSRPAVSYNLAARVDATVPDFGSVPMPGTWHSGYSIAQFPGDGQEIIDFYLVIHADQTGFNHLVQDATVDDHIQFAWSNAGTHFLANTVTDQGLAVGHRQVPACVIGPCRPSRMREWIPLARDGNRYYVIETVSFSDSFLGPLVVHEGGQRVNFWEKLPP